jgi:hypothetical protein
MGLPDKPERVEEFNCINTDCVTCTWCSVEGLKLYCNYQNRRKKQTIKPTELLSTIQAVEAKLKEYLEYVKEG